MADGFVTPSKTRLCNTIFTRNYQRGGKDIGIAIVTIPVVDVQTVGRVEVTNIGDVSLNVFPEFFSDLTH